MSSSILALCESSVLDEAHASLRLLAGAGAHGMQRIGGIPLALTCIKYGMSMGIADLYKQLCTLGMRKDSQLC